MGWGGGGGVWQPCIMYVCLFVCMHGRRAQERQGEIGMLSLNLNNFRTQNPLRVVEFKAETRFEGSVNFKLALYGPKVGYSI